MGMIIAWRLPVHWVIFTLPIIIGIQYIFPPGLTIGLSVLNVRHRDLHQVLASFLTLWFFQTRFCI